MISILDMARNKSCGSVVAGGRAIVGGRYDDKAPDEGAAAGVRVCDRAAKKLLSIANRRLRSVSAIRVVFSAECATVCSRSVCNKSLKQKK